MEIPSLLRQAEHQAFREICLQGSVLDLGGSNISTYQSLLQGSFEITTLNIDPKTKPDILHDLELPLPIENTTFDAVLLVNVLEHVYHYKELLTETSRVLRPGGMVVIVVPFLFPIHPSPCDYHRWTDTAINALLEELGYVSIHVRPLGEGVFSAGYVFLDRLMPRTIRFINYYSIRYVVKGLDLLFSRIAQGLSKAYDSQNYALGYCVTAKKPEL